jgi:hypothetical protein
MTGETELMIGGTELTTGGTALMIDIGDGTEVMTE